MEPLFIAWGAIASKDIVPVLHGTLKDVFQVVNYIKRSAKNTQYFQKLGQDLDSEHVKVLYHAEVHWLSREKVSSHFYDYELKSQPFLPRTIRFLQTCLEKVCG